VYQPHEVSARDDFIAVNIILCCSFFVVFTASTMRLIAVFIGRKWYMKGESFEYDLKPQMSIQETLRKQQYPLLFFFTLASISLLRFLFLFTWTLPVLTNILIDPVFLESIVDILSTVSGIFYVNVYFTVLLSWVELYHLISAQINHTMINTDGESLDCTKLSEQDLFVIFRLRVIYVIISFILLVLVSLDAIFIVLCAKNERYKIQRVGFMIAYFSILVLLHIMVGLIFLKYGVKMRLLLHHVLSKNLLVRIRSRKMTEKGEKKRFKSIAVKITAVTIICNVVIVIRVISYLYQLQHYIVRYVLNTPQVNLIFENQLG
jgi:hypothetical protein